MEMDDVERELLENLEYELDSYNHQLMEIAVEVLRNEVSRYPIFVAHRQDVELGKKFIDNDIYGSVYSFSISHLEDFVNKGIVAMEKVEEFKKVYKNPTQFICLFLISDDGGRFIFYPYK